MPNDAILQYHWTFFFNVPKRPVTIRDDVLVQNPKEGTYHLLLRICTDALALANLCRMEFCNDAVAVANLCRMEYSTCNVALANLCRMKYCTDAVALENLCRGEFCTCKCLQRGINVNNIIILYIPGKKHVELSSGFVEGGYK